MEEIDIIELLKRVKEGKAPKRIEIDAICYRLIPYYEGFSIEYWYEDDEENRWKIEEYTLYTKIKILDKPIIEELDENENIDIYELARKVNQIIRHINKEEK